MTKFEQLMQSNPLLRGLPLELSWTKLMQQLAVNPFAGEDLTSLQPAYREYLVDQYESLYVPSANTTQIAYDIHRMLINGLIDRHPHSPAHKFYAYLVLQHAHGVTATFPASVAPSRGILLKGVTKMGKSRLIERVLAA